MVFFFALVKVVSVSCLLNFLFFFFILINFLTMKGCFALYVCMGAKLLYQLVILFRYFLIGLILSEGHFLYLCICMCVCVGRGGEGRRAEKIVLQRYQFEMSRITFEKDELIY